MYKKSIGIVVFIVLLTTDLLVVGENQFEKTDQIRNNNIKTIWERNLVIKNNGLLGFLIKWLKNEGVYIKNATGKTSRPLKELNEQLKIFLNFRFTNPEAFVDLRGVFGGWWHFEGPKAYRAVLFYGNVTKISSDEYDIEGYCMRIEIY